MFATFLPAWYWFKDESAEYFPQNLRRNTCVSWFGRRFCVDQSSGGQSFVAGVEGTDGETPVLAPEVLPLVKFEDAPLFDVIRVLARQADLEAQIDPRVLTQLFPAVTIRLENVTAQDVLQAVLANNNLILVKHAKTNLVGITTK